LRDKESCDLRRLGGLDWGVEDRNSEEASWEYGVGYCEREETRGDYGFEGFYIKGPLSLSLEEEGERERKGNH
jgi:hypothetical protein